MAMIVVSGPASIQNSKEWLDWRALGIGASEAPIIMGKSKYSTAYELFRRRLGIGPSPPPNHYLETLRNRGKRLEPIARAAYERHTGKVVTPLIAISAINAIIRASFDGYDPFDNVPLEIKCPGAVAHAIALSGSVPDEYYDQVQQQIFVCGSTHGHYYSFDGTDGVLLEVARNQSRIDEILKAAEDFWHRLQLKVWSSNEWDAAAAAWRQANANLQIAKAREEHARDLLVALVPKGIPRQEGGGVSVLMSGRRGTVDYRRMLADAGVVLTEAQIDMYRNNPSSSARVRDVNPADPTLLMQPASLPTVTTTKTHLAPATNARDIYAELNLSPIPGRDFCF